MTDTQKYVSKENLEYYTGKVKGYVDEKSTWESVTGGDNVTPAFAHFIRQGCPFYPIEAGVSYYVSRDFVLEGNNRLIPRKADFKKATL